MFKTVYVLLLAFTAILNMGLMISFAEAVEIYVVDDSQVIERSKYGKYIKSEYDAKRACLDKEQRSISEELTKEEEVLVSLRDNIRMYEGGEREERQREFNGKADKFHVKVQSRREEVQIKSSLIELEYNRAREKYRHHLQEILNDISSKIGADIIIPISSVFVFNREYDLTNEVIEVSNSIFDREPREEKPVKCQI